MHLTRDQSFPNPWRSRRTDGHGNSRGIGGDWTAATKRDSAEAEVFDTVHGGALRFFPAVVEELGFDAAPLLRHVGIDPKDLLEGRSDATYRQLIDLIEFAAAELGCPDFGMRFARLQGGVPLFGPLGSVMKNSRTFGDALDYVKAHGYAHSLAVRFRFQRLPGEAMIFVGHNILLDGISSMAQTVEKFLLDGRYATMSITGGNVRPRKVHFRHQPVSPLPAYRRYFGCEVCFGRNEDGLFFSDQDLACPIISPDAGAYQAATSFIEAQFTRHRPPLPVEVRGRVMQFLEADDCTNVKIAAELNLHPRTLHRRLTAEGTSFREIRDEVRRDAMLYYIQQTELGFAQISEKLGFTEQAVMTKSCNRWFSMCPSQLRAQARRALPSLGSPLLLRNA